jgi:hypothetical protein
MSIKSIAAKLFAQKIYKKKQPIILLQRKESFTLIKENAIWNRPSF